jgi:hypothetical protein
MNYYFFVGWKSEDFLKFVEKKYGRGLVELEPGTVGRTRMLENGGGCTILIWVKFKGKKGFPTLAHECLHAANWTLERAGWQPHLYNDEPQTYLMTSLIRSYLGEE